MKAARQYRTLRLPDSCCSSCTYERIRSHPMRHPSCSSLSSSPCFQRSRYRNRRRGHRGRVSYRIGLRGHHFYTVGRILGLRDVLVGVFSAETVFLLNIFETIVHETTVAAVVTFGTGAINQFLLTEGD